MTRIHWQCRRLLAASALALAATLPPALAQAPGGGPAATGAPAGAELGHNVYTAGGTVRADGPVDGDFVAAGGRVVVDQPIRGDALLIGGTVDVRGPVGDDLRAIGGDVHIDGTVVGEVHAAGGSVSLSRSSRVGRGLSVAAGRVSVGGHVSGPLRARAQRIVIDGQVDGDALLSAESIELGPQARISGALRYASAEFERAEGAVVGGPLTHDRTRFAPRERDGGDRRHWDDAHEGGTAWSDAMLGYLGLLATGVVVLLLFPRFSAGAPERLLAAPGRSLALGFGALVGVPVLVVLLFVTVLGIPLGLAALSVYPLLLLLGYVVGVLFIAQRLRQGFAGSAAADLRHTVLYMAASLFILLLIAWLPLVGALSVIVTLAAGIGACLLEWRRRRQAEPTTTA